jgi:hypothetical protein
MIKAIIKRLAILCGGAVAWYLLFLLIAITAFPVPPEKVFDANKASSTVFETDFRYIAYCAPLQNFVRGKRIFFFGSSNPLLGFRPEEIGAFFPSYSIHNFCARESNMSQIRSIADYAVNGLDPRDLVCVIGIWYGTFSEYHSLYLGKRNHFDREKSQYKVGGFELFPAGGGRNRLRLASYAIYPYLCISHYGKKWWDLSAEKFLGIKRKSDLQLFNLKECQPADPGPSDRLRNITSVWVHNTLQLSGIDREQLEELHEMCRSLRARGISVIVVDLPTPEWHKALIPLFRTYQNVKLSSLRRLESIGVVYVNIQNLSNGGDFSDMIHPCPEATAKWAKAFYEGLAGIPGFSPAQVVGTTETGK